MTKIIPVIHYADNEQALRNAERAFNAGCHGVFLIDMAMRRETQSLLYACGAIKKRWPDKLVGVNLLGVDPEVAVKTSEMLGLDMTWIDEQLTHSSRDPWFEARRVAKAPHWEGHLIFVGVAFKYQPDEPDAALAARTAVGLGLIPTTSGEGTGLEAGTGKVADIRAGIGEGGPLAIASGITPENAATYAPYLTHMLVATGVSDGFHEFSEERLGALIGALASIKLEGE